MIKRHIVEIIEELDKDGKVVSRTTTTITEVIIRRLRRIRATRKRRRTQSTLYDS
jgi:hypothetical protein